MKGHKTIASIDIKERKFWLKTTNEISVVHQKSLVMSNLVTALGAKEKKLSSKT